MAARLYRPLSALRLGCNWLMARASLIPRFQKLFSLLRIFILMSLSWWLLVAMCSETTVLPVDRGWAVPSFISL